MAKRINAKLTGATMTDMRHLLIPANTECSFYSNWLKALYLELEEIKTNEISEKNDRDINEISEQIAFVTKKVNDWKSDKAFQKSIRERLLPTSFLNSIKKGLDTIDNNESWEHNIYPWLEYIGFDNLKNVSPVQGKKLHEFILADSNRLYNIKDNNKVLKSDDYIRSQLITAVMNWLVYVRKQYDVGGTRLEPTFTKKVSVTAEAAVL